MEERQARGGKRYVKMGHGYCTQLYFKFFSFLGLQKKYRYEQQARKNDTKCTRARQLYSTWKRLQDSH